MTAKPTTQSLLEEILTTRICRSHADIIHELRKYELTLTQASVSRALTRLGAVKVLLPDGTAAWRLHKGTVQQPKLATTRATRAAIAHHFAEKIIANGTLFTILGKPDSGRYLGTYVDDAALPSVAGTIAGGNTLLVIPFSQRGYQTTLRDLKLLFPETLFTING